MHVEEVVTGFGAHHATLAKTLAAGVGAADVEAIEVGYIAKFTASPQYFVDLRSFGAGARKKLYLPWKWQQGVARNGALVGLGTDIGSLAMCYRKDEFRQAGLPTSRGAVGKLWPTWSAYIKAGRRFQAHAPNGIHFFDSGGDIFRAMAAQLDHAYYNDAGELIVASNPKLKAAWNATMTALRAGQSAAFLDFSSDWATGFESGIFATIPCPAWMMGIIQTDAPKAGGKWDIAAPPGGGGNWGGSFLAVPRQSQNQDLAVQLAEFLTSPASELHVFEQTGNLPSLAALLRRPEVQRLKSAYFSGAPVGTIFAASALKLRPQPAGVHQGDIENAAVAAITRVERGESSASSSWAQFVRDAQALR